jgi:acetyl esterase/lipase
MYARSRYRLEVDRKPSLASRALNAWLRVAVKRRLPQDADIARLRSVYERLDARQFAPPRDVVRESVTCGGVPAEWVRVPTSRDERVLLYFHGGSFAFRFPNAHAAFASRLARRLGMRALIPDYRLAPENPFPAAPSDCHATYRWLLGQGVEPRNVVFAGDSAGGNLALVTLHRARRSGEPMPRCAILLSPAVDCTLTSPSFVDNQRRDPMLRLESLLVLRRHYVPSPHDYTNPEVSPLFGDFAGFPPLFFQAGSTEILRDEATRAADKANAAGVDVELELWPDAAHAFQIVPFLPEASLALDSIVRFVCKRTGWRDCGA